MPDLLDVKDAGKAAVDELTKTTIPELDEDAKAIIDYFFIKFNQTIDRLNGLTVTSPLGEIKLSIPLLK